MSSESVVLAKLFYCVSFCAPVFVYFSVWFSLEKPARQTSFFIKNFFSGTGSGSGSVGEKILYKKLGLDEDDSF